MTLDEWVALTSAERNEARMTWWRQDHLPFESEGWKKQGSVLLQEAADLFTRKYQNHPLINRIDRSAWFDSLHEPAILVVTALFAPPRIEELPDRWATFAVTQEPILDSKCRYLEYWAIALTSFLGWTKDTVREWAREHWEDGLDGKDPLFYHEPPSYYVAPLLIPDSMRRESGAMIHLASAIARAIDQDGGPTGVRPYDWAAAKARVRIAIEGACS